MRKHIKVILIISLFISLGILTCTLLLYKKYNTPHIVLIGNDTITMNVYDTYNELGAKAIKNEKDISDKIKIEGKINNSKPGNYKISYTVDNNTIYRNVIVKDNVAPEISLVGNDYVVVGKDTEYIDEGAKATDNIDGDITDKIEITGKVNTKELGDYTLTYQVKDSSNNVSTITRTISVKSTSTYIKISIDNQKLWFFKNNKLFLSSDIVTGNIKNHNTPKGTFKVYEKARNVYLKGPGYLSYVNYWMAIHGGIGLHDATWRDEFGGKIYETDGSHGCINLPKDIASKIYENVSIVTVVEVY